MQPAVKGKQAFAMSTSDMIQNMRLINQISARYFTGNPNRNYFPELSSRCFLNAIAIWTSTLSNKSTENVWFVVSFLAPTL
jgi:hypothetical protein